MKPSSWLFILTLSVSFAIGFGLGAFPRQWQKLTGKPSENLVVLLGDAQMLPRDFALDFEKTTGVSIEVKVADTYLVFRSEAQNADVLLAPLAWLGTNPEILAPLEKNEELHQLLSADFQNLPFDLKNFLPVFWKTENRESQTHLVIWGLATPKNQHSQASTLIEFLTGSSQRLKLWAQATGLVSTFEISNGTPDFPEAQRARKIREVSLSNLMIDQKLENPSP